MPSYVYVAEVRDTPRILLWVQMMNSHFSPSGSGTLACSSLYQQIPKDVGRNWPEKQLMFPKLSLTLLAQWKATQAQ